MQCNSILTRMGVLEAALLVVLTLVPPSLAAPQYKVLYAFEGGNDGVGVYSGVAFDCWQSLRLAPVSWTASGTPRPSQIR